jgi:hypothetical protein
MAGGNPTSALFAWTPGANPDGVYMTCFVAQDDWDYMSEINCVTVYVDAGTNPNPISMLRF